MTPSLHFISSHVYQSQTHPAEAMAATTVDEGVKTDVEDQIALHCARLHHRHRGGLRARASGTRGGCACG